MARRPPHISASVLNADFARLGDEVARAAAGGVDSIHLDVMDGHFVDNISFGAPVVAALRPARQPPVPRPPHDRGATALRGRLRPGGERPHRVPRRGRRRSRSRRSTPSAPPAGRPGSPSTRRRRPNRSIAYLDRIDLLLVMTVHPGFGGQAFLADVLPKLERPGRRGGPPAGWTSRSRSTAGSTSTPSRPAYAAGGEVLVRRLGAVRPRGRPGAGGGRVPRSGDRSPRDALARARRLAPPPHRLSSAPCCRRRHRWPPAPASIPILPDPTPGPVTVTVTDAASGEPVAGAQRDVGRRGGHHRGRRHGGGHRPGGRRSRSRPTGSIRERARSRATTGWRSACATTPCAEPSATRPAPPSPAPGCSSRGREPASARPRTARTRCQGVPEEGTLIYKAAGYQLGVIPIDEEMTKDVTLPPFTARALYAPSAVFEGAGRLDAMLAVIDQTEVNAMVIDVKETGGWLYYSHRPAGGGRGGLAHVHAGVRPRGAPAGAQGAGDLHHRPDGGHEGQHPGPVPTRAGGPQHGDRGSHGPTGVAGPGSTRATRAWPSTWRPSPATWRPRASTRSSSTTSASSATARTSWPRRTCRTPSRSGCRPSSASCGSSPMSWPGPGPSSAPTCSRSAFIATDDQGIGQRPEVIMPYVDYFSPMVYPSHYYPGVFDVAGPERAARTS